MAKRTSHLNQMASYFVQMRETERRLLTGALQACEDLGGQDKAAEILGIPLTYFRVRARVLGGVLPDDPKHEPPTMTVTEAWGKEGGNRLAKPPRKRTRKAPLSPTAEELAVLTAPADPVEEEDAPDA